MRNENCDSSNRAKGGTVEEAPEAQDAMVFETPGKDQLKSHSVRGGAITMGNQAFKFVLQTFSVAVLARILSPVDFGLQSMVVVVVGALNLFRDAGLGAATVQSETVTQKQLTALFWINLAVGVVLALMLVVLAPVLVAINNEPRLFWIAVISATSFVIAGASAQHGALLQRHMRFSTMAKIDIASQTLSCVIAVLMAMWGFGYWALVAMTISGYLISSIAQWMCVPWKPGAFPGISGVRSMLHLGGTVTLNNIVVYAGYNTEKILVGRYWGAETLGLYGRAYQLINLPLQQLYNAVYTVAFPALARIQGDSNLLRRSFLKGYSVLLSISIPVNILAAIYSEEIVQLLLGPKWTAAATILRILTPAVTVFALINPFGWLLIASGRAVRSLNMALVIAPVVIAGIAFGLPFGPNGVALGYSIAMTLLYLPLVVWALSGTGITMRDYWSSVSKPLIAGMVMGIVALLFKVGFGEELLSFRLIPIVCLVAGLYAWILVWGTGQRDLYVDLINHALKRSPNP